MELFRHYFTATEWGTSVFFQQHLNDFGFCNMDGSPITNTWDDTTFTARYKYDPKGEMFIANRTSYTSTSAFDSPGCFPYLSNDHSKCKAYYDDTLSPGTYGPYPATIFFIPLINRGFFLHIRSANIHVNIPDIVEYSNDPRDQTFHIDTPTPNLNIRIYGANDPTNLNRCAGCGVCNLIGLPPSSGNPNYWTYLLYNRNPKFNTEQIGATNYNCSLIDYGNSRVSEIPFLSEYIRETDGTSHENSIYTNTNANVCALIKVPFDTGYIDNLYLLATSPRELADATFFSFNGRNFLNVFDNYVIELPSTSN